MIDGFGNKESVDSQKYFYLSPRRLYLKKIFKVRYLVCFYRQDLTLVLVWSFDTCRLEL